MNHRPRLNEAFRYETLSVGLHRGEVIYLEVGDVLGMSVIEAIESKQFVLNCRCGEVFTLSKRVLNNRHGAKFWCGNCVDKSIIYRLRRVWYHIMWRCYKPGFKFYKNYGGRSIFVDYEPWRLNPYSFIAFALDNGWEEGLKTDRIDNDKGYFPDNVRFVTHKINSRNRTDNFPVEFDGEVICLSELAERTGINRQTLLNRITRDGYTLEQAVALPVIPHRTQSGRLAQAEEILRIRLMRTDHRNA